MEQREEAARTEILTERVDALVSIIGGLAKQGNEEHTEIEQEKGAKSKKKQIARQFQSQSMSEQLRSMLDIPTICLIYKSLLRYVSRDRQIMGEATDADQKALIGIYNLLWVVSGKEPDDWYGVEEDQAVNRILNITDKQTVHSYAEMR